MPGLQSVQEWVRDEGVEAAGAQGDLSSRLVTKGSRKKTEI